jgi:hypothetical protein
MLIIQNNEKVACGIHILMDCDFYFDHAKQMWLIRVEQLLDG